jgi:hypothetical protein
VIIHYYFYPPSKQDPEFRYPITVNGIPFATISITILEPNTLYSRKLFLGIRMSKM